MLYFGVKHGTHSGSFYLFFSWMSKLLSLFIFLRSSCAIRWKKKKSQLKKGKVCWIWALLLRSTAIVSTRDRNERQPFHLPCVISPQGAYWISPTGINKGTSYLISTKTWKHKVNTVSVEKRECFQRRSISCDLFSRINIFATYTATFKVTTEQFNILGNTFIWGYSQQPVSLA